VAACCQLLDPAAEPVPPAWGRFVASQRLSPAWDAAALATLAPRHPRLLLGLVEHDGLTAAAFCGRPRGPWALPAVFECKLLPMGSTPGVAFAADLDRAGRRAAVAAFEQALARRLGWRWLGVAYRQVGQTELDAYDGPGRPRISTSPVAVLENRWATMDEYLAGLSHRRRGRLRAMQRALVADPDLQVEIGGQVAADAASELAFQTELRHRRGRLDAPGEPVPAAYFDALAGREGVLYLTYRDGGGRLLAFALAFDDGECLDATVWGSLDPHAGGHRNLLFDHYLRLIALAIERQRAAVGFGKPVTDAKRRFGCTSVPQFMVAATRFTQS
jgi:uncharacterized protein